MTDICKGWNQLPSFEEEGPYVTWGVFDGVHRGHQHIIQTLVRRAEEQELPSVVLTFDPHPLEVLKDRSPGLLCSPDARVEFLEDIGPDVIGVIPFTRSFSRQTPSEFYQSILRERLQVRGVVLGEGARFGKNKEGDIDRLQELSRSDAVEVVSCAHKDIGGERVSSSRIRRVISEGDLEEAETLLGRPVMVSGNVIRGQGRGREIGYPTANLDLDHDVYPPRGIYGGRVVLGGTLYPAVTSIGVRPTFQGEEQEVVEVHLLDFSGDLYDRTIRFQFHCFLREEEEYDQVEELIDQIEQDIQDFKQHPSYPEK